MGIGENVYDLLKGEIKYFIYIALAVVGVKMIISKKATAAISMVILLILAIGFLQFPGQILTFLENVFNKIVPAS